MRVFAFYIIALMLVLVGCKQEVGFTSAESTESISEIPVDPIDPPVAPIVKILQAPRDSKLDDPNDVVFQVLKGSLSQKKQNGFHSDFPIS